MNRWILKLENGQAQLEGMVCVGDSDDVDSGFRGYDIEVCLGNLACPAPP